MKAILIAIGAVALLASAYMMMSNNSLEQFPKSSEWEIYKSKFNKKYQNIDEERYRMILFIQKKKWIEENQGKDGITYGINQLSDLSDQEFKALYLGYVHNAESTKRTDMTEAEFNAINAPEAVNWVTAGAAGTVLNQGQCGSCWAFSATQAIQSSYFVNKNWGYVPQLSEEQLVQCSKLYGNLGCNGGMMNRAFNYVIQNPITTSAIYPYTSGTGTTGSCDSAKAKTGNYTMTSYKTIPSGNCQSLVAGIALQPVSVAVDASTWSSYKSGIFTNCGTQLDHGVLAVGYNMTGPNPYYLVKNSWDVNWGENGYITLSA